jgi:glutathione S-transferase
MAANNNKLELHALPLSPPSRAVHMALDVLGLDYDYVHVDVLGGGTRTPEFLSMNPQHTVPVLVDGNHVITGTHFWD